MSQLLPKPCTNNVKKAAARDECAAAAEAADRAAAIELLADLAVEEQQQETSQMVVKPNPLAVDECLNISSLVCYVRKTSGRPRKGKSRKN